ncbi:MAG: hypothetical protein ACRDL7_08895 [Gaiellaceae bacterium]
MNRLFERQDGACVLVTDCCARLRKACASSFVVMARPCIRDGTGCECAASGARLFFILATTQTSSPVANAFNG